MKKNTVLTKFNTVQYGGGGGGYGEDCRKGRLGRNGELRGEELVRKKTGREESVGGKVVTEELKKGIEKGCCW